MTFYLNELHNNIWTVDGPDIDALGGFHFPTHMMIIRLPNNDLWIWSPVGFSLKLAAEVAKLSAVTHLFCPNHLNHIFTSDGAKAFPYGIAHGPITRTNAATLLRATFSRYAYPPPFIFAENTLGEFFAEKWGQSPQTKRAAIENHRPFIAMTLNPRKLTRRCGFFRSWDHTGCRR